MAKVWIKPHGRRTKPKRGAQKINPKRYDRVRKAMRKEFDAVYDEVFNQP